MNPQDSKTDSNTLIEIDVTEHLPKKRKSRKGQKSEGMNRNKKMKHQLCHS